MGGPPPVRPPQENLLVVARDRRVLVVVPAFNEQDTVADVIRDVNAAVPYADVVVVDDASTDATRARALAAGATVLSLPFNLGVGGAMRAGFRYALRGGYDRVVQIDGDRQHDATCIERLLDALEGCDVVVGTRFGGEREYAVSAARGLAMRLLSRTLSRWAGTPLTDTTSGFRGCNARALVLFARHYPAEYLGDTVESLVMAIRCGLTVREVPVTMHERGGGRPSQRPWTAAVYLLRAIVALLLARVRRWDVPPDPDPAAEPERGAPGLPMTAERPYARAAR